MKCFRDHGGIERRLKRRWRQALKAHPQAHKLRTGTAGAVLSSLNFGTLWRYIFWMAAFLPFPQGWAAAAFLSLWATLFWAGQLASRGGEEALLALYGADDEGILDLSRRWMRGVAVWSAADAGVFLGIWWLGGSVPWWAVLLGLPCYVVATVVGTRLLANIIPASTLLMLSFGICVLAIVVDRLRAWQTPQLIETGIWVFGALTPAGWTVLMLRDLVAGQVLLLAMLPLLGAGVLLARAIARSQESKLLRLVCVEDPSAAFDREEEAPEESFENMQPDKDGKFSEQLLLQRAHGGLKFPDTEQPPSRRTSRLAWNVGIVLLAALNVRFDVLFSEQFRAVVFVGTVVLTYVIWLPMLGLPVWLQSVAISVNRVASFFVFFPISLRHLIKSQIQTDLGNIRGRILPLTVFSMASFAIALSAEWTTTIAFGLTMTLFFLLLIPIRWFHCATSPLANKPFGVSNIVRGALMIAMVLLFLLETVFGVLFISTAVMLQSELFLGGFFLVFAVLNAALGMLGTYLALLAYEKGWTDLVRLPPRQS